MKIIWRKHFSGGNKSLEVKAFFFSLPPRVVLMQFWCFSIWKLWIKTVVLLYFVWHRFPHTFQATIFLNLEPMCQLGGKKERKGRKEGRMFSKTSSWVEGILHYFFFFSAFSREIIFQAFFQYLYCKAVARLELEITPEPLLRISNAVFVPKSMFLEWWCNQWNLKCYEKGKQHVFEKPQ